VTAAGPNSLAGELLDVQARARTNGLRILQ
jgi:hypothetical protein